MSGFHLPAPVVRAVLRVISIPQMLSDKRAARKFKKRVEDSHYVIETPRQHLAFYHPEVFPEVYKEYSLLGFKELVDWADKEYFIEKAVTFVTPEGNDSTRWERTIIVTVNSPCHNYRAVEK